jgi:hypothetical protein
VIAFFTFKLADLSAKLTESNQWEWLGPCKADIQGVSFGHFIRGALFDLESELSIQNISECDLVTKHVVANFDNQPAALELQQELSTAQAEGTADAMILTKYEKMTEGGQTMPELLGITIGLRPQRYELFRTFVTLHFGRADVIGRIGFTFFGFAASSQGGLTLPSKAEFMNGRPYLVVGDGSLWFSAARSS